MHDIDAEAGDSLVEPEPEDIVHRVPDLIVPPVEIGLGIEEVVKVVLTRNLIELPCAPSEQAHPVVRRRSVRLGIGPYEPVPVAGVLRRERLHEPRVGARSVVGDEVHQDLDPAGAGFGDQLFDVFDRAELGMDARVVGDVVPLAVDVIWEARWRIGGAPGDLWATSPTRTPGPIGCDR